MRLAGYAASCMQDLRGKWTSRLSSRRPGMHCPGPVLTALALAHAMTTKPAPAAACMFTPAACEAGVSKLRHSGIGTKSCVCLTLGPGLPCTADQLRHLLPRLIFSAIGGVLLPLAHSRQRASAIPLRKSGASIGFGRPEADRSRLSPLAPAQKM
ncbi:hypothetical protein B0H13DRAFT_871308 [Mycena leptocephala]|nr:hypothetical protein B0H13DRAFT_871308 [Mycena leptocephala]